MPRKTDENKQSAEARARIVALDRARSFIILLVLIGGALLFVQVVVRTAAREYARARAEEERRQRDQHP